MIKRLFDIGVAACALLLAWPFILFGALAVQATSPGPAFYRAKRAGRGGQPFQMLKLRTMRVATEASDRKITAADDDRITPVGQWLRKLKIDELPQFWNVLRGDMSIVGPRPEDWDIMRQYYTPEQMRILAIRPGITSLGSVLWYPDLTYHDPPPPEASMQEWYLQRHLPLHLSEALHYMDQQSLWLDVKVLAQTAYCVLVYSWKPPHKQPLTAFEFSASNAATPMSKQLDG